MTDIDKNLNIIEKETKSKIKDDEDLDASFIIQSKKYRNKLAEYGYKINILSHPFNLLRVVLVITVIFLIARYVAPLCSATGNKILKLIEEDSKIVLSLEFAFYANSNKVHFADKQNSPHFATVIITNIITKYIDKHHK